MDLKGKTALVTGGGSGICLAFAERLLQRGCNVVIADLRLSEEADKLVQDSTNGPTKAVFIKTDVTDWTQLQAAFDKAINEFGRLDVVCPGAGAFEPQWSSFWSYGPSNTTTVDTLASSHYKTLDINLTHPIRCTQLAIDYFLRQHPLTSDGHPIKRGHVVHISSVAAQTVNPVVPLYLTSKAALSHFVRSMGGVEASFGVRVNAVAPGQTRTALWKASEREYIRPDLGDVFIEPGEIADVLIKLVTEDEFEAGTIWEIGKGSLRRVELLNDPGTDKDQAGFAITDPTPIMEGYKEALGRFGK